MTYQLTEESFLREVASHAMEVIRDDGLYRHIRFRRTGTMCMHFDLITWPGYLCYCGDMGTYVFSRIDDMFGFFRASSGDKAFAERQGNRLYINPAYWSEKLQSVDGNRHKAAAMEFDEKRFRAVINEYRRDWMRSAKDSASPDKGERRELWEAVDNDVLAALDDGGDRAMYAAYDFNWSPGAYFNKCRAWSFDGLFDHSFQRFTHHFMWCCYALAWGVELYDKSHAATVAAA